MPWKALILAAIATALLVSGCGESDEPGPAHMSPGQMQRRMQGHRAAMRARMHHRATMRRARMRARHRAMMTRRHYRQTMRRHRAAMRRLHAEEAARHAAEAEEASTEEASSECDPNYTGACLDPYASDYDCEGGSGNGPKYTGEVTVVGVDHNGLDADGDGIGCESE
ncbi:MAG: hypothetical protein ACTHNP_10350 [Solirubrobacterales bacterium]